jgi:hypothetical protein
MGAPITSIHESDDNGQELLNQVVQLFTDLLIAGGATLPMIRSAMASTVDAAVEGRVSATYTELGSVLRDCMEVMCAWRRDVDLVDSDGEPRPLPIASEMHSFEALCRKAGCRNSHAEILSALLTFGAVTQDSEGLVHSQTPTFLLGAATSGGRIATDGLIKQLEAFLQSVHRNVCSVSGRGIAKFERACTVTVAAELEPIFDRLVRSRGQEFIDSIDEWLERHTRFDSPSGTYVELGAGAYFIDLGPRRRRERMRPEQKKHL